MVQLFFPEYPINLFGGNSVIFRFSISVPILERSADDLKEADKIWAAAKSFLDTFYMEKLTIIGRKIYPNIGEMTKDVYTELSKSWPTVQIPVVQLGMEVDSAGLKIRIP